MLVHSQLMNGDFENWIIVKDSIEIPEYWFDLTPNDPLSVSKSEKAYTGPYSVQLSTYNTFHHDFTPVYIASKLEPNKLNYNLSFAYLIDSISDVGNGRILILQKDSNGSEIVIASKTLLNITKEFITDQLPFELNTLDSFWIILGAENKFTPIGNEGFTSVLYDKIILDEIVATSHDSGLDCKPSFMSDYNLLQLKIDCSHFTNYRIYNVLGMLLKQSVIENQNIPIEYNGIVIVQLTGETGESMSLKIVNH